MSRKYPLTFDDVIRGMKAMGFSQRPRKSTGHIQWAKYSVPDPNTGETQLLHKVTVSTTKAPFDHRLVKSMASQAGVSTKLFREICSKGAQKKAKRCKLNDASV